MRGVAHSAVLPAQRASLFKGKVCGVEKKIFFLGENIVLFIHYILVSENFGTVFHGHHMPPHRVSEFHGGFKRVEKT